MYFENAFPADFEIIPNPELVNKPVFVCPDDVKRIPEAGKPLHGDDLKEYVTRISKAIADLLKLEKQ
jgi:threonine synthase